MQKRVYGFNLREEILTRNESRVKLSSVRDARIAGYHRRIRARGDRKYDTGGVSVRCKSIERYGPRRRDGTERNGGARRWRRPQRGESFIWYICHSCARKYPAGCHYFAFYRRPDEINAHTFSIRILRSLLSREEARSNAFSVSAAGKSAKIVERLREEEKGYLFIYTYMRRDCRTQLKHERACRL